MGDDWMTLGTISLDIHLVQIGEANRLHEGYSSYHRRNEAAPLSSATPFSSTEVTSVGKIATFVFKYRPLDILQYHSIAPVTATSSLGSASRLGEKRSAPDDCSDSEPFSVESDDRQMLRSSLIFASSDSDSSQVSISRFLRSVVADFLLGDL
jgi:hypothetical protein